MATRKTIEQDEAASELPLHLKYRPTNLKDVYGQDAVVKSLRSALGAKTRPHCFLFTGPAGTGKTTLARILASELGIGADGVIEVDAASNSGIDDMRKLTEGLRYTGFGANPNRLLLLNECQGLSKAAWDSLLTTTEEPPKHVYFAFTSTHPAKIPAAMVTRCQSYHLKALRRDDVLDVLEMVCKAEGFETSADVLDMVEEACDGSMRAALTMLAKVHDVKDIDDVADLLRQPLDNKDVIELARALISRDLSWKKLTATLKEMGDSVAPESTRIIICNYVGACLMNPKGEKEARDLWYILDAFARPMDATLGNAALLHAFGRVMFD